MEQNRVRIVDVADALGLSTATVSKVIQEEVLHKILKKLYQFLKDLLPGICYSRR